MYYPKRILFMSGFALYIFNKEKKILYVEILRWLVSLLSSNIKTYYYVVHHYLTPVVFVSNLL